jgi:hypothetical protein
MVADHQGSGHSGAVTARTFHVCSWVLSGH